MRRYCGVVLRQAAFLRVIFCVGGPLGREGGGVETHAAQWCVSMVTN